MCLVPVVKVTLEIIALSKTVPTYEEEKMHVIKHGCKKKQKEKILEYVGVFGRAVL